MYKKIIKYIGVIILLCVVLGCSNYSKEPGRHYNKKKGFSIQLPDGWIKSKKVPFGVTVGFENPKKTEDIMIQVQRISPEQTLAEALKFMKSQINSINGRIVREGDAIIDGHDAQWLIGIVDNEKILYYLTKKDDKLFAIMLGCQKDNFSDEFEKNMEEVARTFRFES